MTIIVKILAGVCLYLAGFIAFYMIGWALTAGVLNSLNNHFKNNQKNGKENE